MSDPGEEWQLAGRKIRASRKSKSYQLSKLSCCEESVDIRKTVKRIKDSACELLCEEFWPEWKDHLLVARSTALSAPQQNTDEDDITVPKERERICAELECVCYGLGRFSSCVSARYQLAMLLLLLDAGKIPLKKCYVYDPAFSPGERDVLRELGLTVLTENEEGKHLTTGPTLFYLMHCGKALYNNLLWKNWSAQRLPLMIIIGNSFSSMWDRMIEREFKQDYSYISQAVSVCKEKLLPCPSHLIDVFSDTSVITFSTSSLNRIERSTWMDPPEPQYQHCPDLEIILREAQN